MDKTNLVYLIGMPGVGKYTIARELERQYGFRICDNHLINNPIFSLLGKVSHIPDFAWEYVDRIRAVVFEFIKRMRGSYVLTNCLYDTNDDLQIYKQVLSLSEARNSNFVPVLLVVEPEEHRRRIMQEGRRLRYKSTDPKLINLGVKLLQIEHPNLLQLDITYMEPEAVAKVIMWRIGKGIST